MKNSTYKVITFISLIMMPRNWAMDQKVLNRRLKTAIVTRKVKRAKALIAAGADVNYGDIYGTLLSLAGGDGHDALVCLLLERGADPNRYTTGLKVFPLQRAAFYGHERVVKILLDAGARVDNADAIGWTALHGAVLRGQLEVARLLIERGSPVDPRNRMGNTPLHFAANSGNCDLIGLLTEHGANPLSKNNMREIPLMNACRAGNIDAVMQLISAGGLMRCKKVLSCLYEFFVEATFKLCCEANHPVLKCPRCLFVENLKDVLSKNMI